ncbi:MAG: hypothetical protein GY789_26990 [Hyphomicrobiales bacterium]|nr:hypothetical protein [Hyphomicrobiales bacterium]MCP5001133.1 hypothetical protein [Hyphomicrobiales bacterium]
MRYVRLMGQNSDKAKSRTPAEIRKERLAGELRANLQRRKKQVRARRHGNIDEASGLPAAGGQKRP